MSELIRRILIELTRTEEVIRNRYKIHGFSSDDLKIELSEETYYKLTKNQEKTKNSAETIFGIKFEVKKELKRDFIVYIDSFNFICGGGEMKNKEWLKEQLSYLQDGVGESFNDYSKGLNAAYNTIGLLINELEEPEQEKAEKLYTACFAPIGTRQGVYLYRESGSVKVGDNMKVYDKSKQEYHLTEKEIKNRDERFWTFAEEITK